MMKVSIKFVLVGPGGVGKTTLKRIFFEQADPIELLRESIEPTYGPETTQYQIGKQISVFDLAGQQLEEWLSQSKDIFEETDVLLLIVDSSEDLNKNIELMKKVLEIREEICSNAIFGVFFHKIDLLVKKNRDKLAKKLKKYIDEDKKVYIFLTSINGKFFAETYLNFSYLIRKAIRRVEKNKIDSRIFKMALVNQFLLKKELEISYVSEILDLPEEEAQKILDDLESEGIIEINRENELIFLTLKGKNMIQKLKRRIYSQIDVKKVLNKIPLKSLIISDHHGRAFLTYEIQKNYFDLLVANEEMESDPQLIAMFFSALSDFGKTIDAEGFYEIHLFAKTVNIIIIVYKEISAIFFLEGIEFKPEISKILKAFIKDFYGKFEKELKKFFQIFGIVNYQDMLEKTEEIVEDLEILLKAKFNISEKSIERKLGDIYFNINDKNIDPNLKTQIKQLITQYSFTKEKSILKEIEKLISGI
ncbi:MAG: ADP-ribosylation factor-like protein [Promethearchaeota archaeon]